MEGRTGPVVADVGPPEDRDGHRLGSTSALREAVFPDAVVPHTQQALPHYGARWCRRSASPFIDTVMGFIDTVIGEVPLPPRENTWRQRAAARVRGTHAAHLRHRRAVPQPTLPQPAVP